MSTQPEQPEEACPVGPGEVLSQRYSLELLIGEGSFGWVFSALDLSHALRRVAVKVLRQRHAAHEDTSRRPERRELALLLRIQELQPTPHVMRALEPDVQRHGDLHYLVLEFIDGPSLREVLDGGIRFEPEQLRRLGADLARGLAALHAAGGVHRDLKPSNIRLRGGHQPVIVDFGTALMLWEPLESYPSGQAPMTPRYASPEQRAGRESTSASDVYAWGVLLHELLTGALPPTPNRGSLPAPGERRELMRQVLRCLEYAPEKRPTAHELVHALSAPSKPRRYLPERSWILGRLALLLLGLGGLLDARRALPPERFSAGSVPVRPLQRNTPDAAPRPSSWSRRFGDATPQRILRLVRDPTGDLFVAGAFQGSLDLGRGPLTSAGAHDLFVARLAPDGTTRWSQRFGDAEMQTASALAVDPKGGLLVFGSFSGTLDFGAWRHISVQGEHLFLVKFDDEGRPLWSMRWGETGEQRARAVAVDAEGNLTLLGTFTESVDFGCGALVSAGLRDVFLTRVTPEGRCLWSQRLGDEEDQEAFGLDVDAAGHSAIVGPFERMQANGPGDGDGDGDLNLKLSLNSLSLSWSSPINTLAVFDARGHLSWSRSLGVSSSSIGYVPGSVHFDPEGQLLYLGELEFLDTEALLPRFLPDLHVARFSADGRVLWSQRLGDLWLIRSAKLALKARGELLIAGAVKETVDLGDGPFPGGGGAGADLFVLELGRQGEFLNARRFGGSVQQVLSVVEGQAGQPLLAGTFENSLDLGKGLLTSAGDLDLFIAQLGPAVPRGPPLKDPRCLPPPPGLSAWYPLDEADPGEALGGARAGKLSPGARPIAGRERGVLSLEGGFFQAPGGTALDVGRGDFSLSLWMRTSESANVRVMLDKRTQGASPGSPVTGYSLHVYRGRLAFQLADGKGSGNCQIDASSSCTNYRSGHFVADGAWHFVTVTVNRKEPDGGTFYVDGAAVTTFSSGLHPGSLDNPGPLRLGSRSFEETGLFKGLLDEVVLWKRVLSPDEVARLYRAGSSGLCRP